MSAPVIYGWLDTNVFVRALFPGDPVQPRCRTILESLERGEGEGWLDPAVVHELTYVLGRLPAFRTRASIRGYIRPLLLSPGLHLDDKDGVIEALDRWATGSTSFVDAWLATLAHRRGLPVCSINRRDFPGIPNSFFAGEASEEE